MTWPNPLMVSKIVPSPLVILMGVNRCQSLVAWATRKLTFLQPGGRRAIHSHVGETGIWTILCVYSSSLGGEELRCVLFGLTCVSICLWLQRPHPTVMVLLPIYPSPFSLRSWYSLLKHCCFVMIPSPNDGSEGEGTWEQWAYYYYYPRRRPSQWHSYSVYSTAATNYMPGQTSPGINVPVWLLLCQALQSVCAKLPCWEEPSCGIVWQNIVTEEGKQRVWKAMSCPSFWQRGRKWDIDRRRHSVWL